jgi:hypothetical protein
MASASQRNRRRAAANSQIASDPFGEHAPAKLRARLNVLGTTCTIEAADPAALRLATDAFGGLPRHRLASTPPSCAVRLVVTDEAPAWTRHAGPPRPRLTAGRGLLCAMVDAGNFAVVDAENSRALVCMSRAMLRHPYHARYELVELAIVTLASRVQSLVPLHAACIGARGAGVLLMGSSGAGKSTLALHALADGMQLIAEDSAFVSLGRLRVTGAPTYLHVQRDALAFLSDRALLARIRRSPTIERRSGARKYEVDLRELPSGIAAAPLRLAATVFVSRRTAAARGALEPLGRAEALRRLRREQPYAAGLPEWGEFERRVARLPAYELRRALHPDAAVRELRALLRGGALPA